MTYRNASQGAASFLLAALDPRLQGMLLFLHSTLAAENVTNGLVDQPGAYVDECQLKDIPSYAQDAALARKLWTLAESWIKNA
jgi:hypothetical protein